jgi:hypothetical protein
MWPKVSLIASIVLVILLIFFARRVNLQILEPVTKDQDIYYSFVEGERLRDGENPYARILDGDMRKNHKYATYFPVFYELSYITQEMGLRPFETWITFWRWVFMVFEFAIAILLFVALARRNLEWLGAFVSAFWLFNRWTLQVVQTANLDFIPIFFLLLSLILFPQKKWLSLFLFSLSLGFKQIAIFLAPLYLIWIYQSMSKHQLKYVFFAGLLIASVPLISGIPFFVWNAEGFIKSVLFSVTRFGADQFGTSSVDVILNWDGIFARLPMIGLLLAIYSAAFKGYGGKFFASLLVMMIFVDFNSVLYVQYFAWILPLLPMVFCDLRETVGNRRLESMKV